MNGKSSTQKIKDLDLTSLQWRLMQDPRLGGCKWEKERAEKAIEEYKKFLTQLSQISLYPDMPLVPPDDVLMVWQIHTEDREKYHAECVDIFGQPIQWLRGLSNKKNAA